MPLPCREVFLLKLVPDTFYTTHVDDIQFSFNNRISLILLVDSCRGPCDFMVGPVKELYLDCSFGAGKACDGILISWTLLPNERAFYKIGISTGGILPTGYLSVFRMQSVRCLGNGTKVFSNSNFIVATCSFSSVQNFHRIYASFPAKLQVFISYCSGSSFQTSINAANEDHAAAWTMLFSFSSLPALFYYFFTQLHLDFLDGDRAQPRSLPDHHRDALVSCLWLSPFCHLWL